MKKTDRHNPPALDSSRAHSRWLWLFAMGCAFIILMGLLRIPRPEKPIAAGVPTNELAEGETAASPRLERPQAFPRRFRSATSPEPTAAEVVAGKLAKFAQSRRSFAYALARRHNVEVSDDVKRFFDAVESGDWDRIEAAFNVVKGPDPRAGRPPGVEPIWPAILDAYGAAEQVHLWPAQKLLDYGNSILGSLKPGMVYVGGTDNGRWIPELLNDTADGERHVILTQNALADGTYLDYLRFQYDDRLVTLTAEDSQRAFQEYLTEARKRLEHDQQFPGEPKQVRPGEDIRITENRVQVGGQVAVMAINEKLLQTLMEKNPDRSFGIQESFPLEGTYADALPLGPLMELRARDEQNSFTADRAAQSLEYWQTAAQQVFADPEASGSPDALKSYSHDINSAANLLAAHQYGSEAEQAYRLSSQLWPGNPEPVVALADLLHRNGRIGEARGILEEFGRQYPDQRSHLRSLRGVDFTVGR